MLTKHYEMMTRSPIDARRLGEQIGTACVPGSIIALTGALGCGKTTIIQGLASGLGVPEDDYITSPTFTLINEYSGRHPLFHVDLYRLEHPDEIEDIGIYDLLAGEGTVAVEWADRLPGLIEQSDLHIASEILTDAKRKLRLSARTPDALKLLDQIQDMTS